MRQQITEEHSVHPPSAAPTRLKELCSLQLLRGLAAAGVVIFHAFASLQYSTGLSLGRNIPTFPQGGMGVDLFFVISGFIMFYISAKAARPPLAFYEARIKRIVPLYWLASLCLFLSPLVSKTIGWASNLSLTHLIASLFFIGGYHNPAFDFIFPVLTQGWTLNFEMFFYLIFGLGLATGTARKSLFITLPTIVALVLIGWIFPLSNSIARFYSNSIMLEFVYGLIIAFIVLDGYILPRYFAWIAIIGGLIVPAFVVVNNDNRFFYHGLPLAFVVWGLVSLELHSNKLWKTRLKIFGDASYSIYLSHQLIMSIILLIWLRVPLLKNMHFLWYVVIAILISFIIGIACYYYVELPLTKWAHKFQLTKKTEAATT